MATLEPRVQAPATAAKGQVFEVKTLISHPMETGLRRGEDGLVIPRKLVNSFACRYDGAVVFSIDLHEAMAANPYLSFYVRAEESGTLAFTWEEDGGATLTLEKPLEVTA